MPSNIVRPQVGATRCALTSTQRPLVRRAQRATLLACAWFVVAACSESRPGIQGNSAGTGSEAGSPNEAGTITEGGVDGPDAASCTAVSGPLLPLDDTSDTRLRVFIAAGQSNMVGADSAATQIDAFPPYVGAGLPVEAVRFSYLLEREQVSSGGWMPLGPVGGSFGPELTFARKVTRFLKAPIAIIKSAVGGTTLWRDWAPSAPAAGLRLYPQMLALVRASLKELDDKQIPYRLEGVLWHQGENDMLDSTHVGEYEANLPAFIARLRNDLSRPNLPFYIGEVSQKGVWGYDYRQNMKQLREQQLRVVAADPTLHWVPTGHVAFLTSGTGPHYHFGTLGQLEHGEQYADAYLRTLGGTPSPPATPYCPGPEVKAGKKLQVFILLGQRSMDGEAAWVDGLNALPAYAALAKPQPATPYQFFLGGGIQQSSDWTPLGPAQFQDWFGPELTLGATLAAALTYPVALIKVADGAAAMPDWAPTPSTAALRPIYANALGFVKRALSQLTSRGIAYELKGVFWAHGELDSWGARYLPDQAATLQALMSSVRTDLSAPTLPWFIAGVSEKLPWSAAATALNEQLKGVVAADPNAHFVDTRDLPFGVVSFGTEGNLALGERFANAYLAP